MNNIIGERGKCPTPLNITDIESSPEKSPVDPLSLSYPSDYPPKLSLITVPNGTESLKRPSFGYDFQLDGRNISISSLIYWVGVGGGEEFKYMGWLATTNAIIANYPII